jgi:hypothetical protein
MAATISQAAQPVIDFRNQKTAAFRDVTEKFAENYQGQILKGVAQGNEIASNSIASLQGRGAKLNISA